MRNWQPAKPVKFVGTVKSRKRDRNNRHKGYKQSHKPHRRGYSQQFEKMSYQNIDAVLTDADKTAILEAIATIKTKLPFMVGLEDSERKKLRKLGAKREGYAKEVSDTLTANPTIVPESFGWTGYQKDLNLSLAMDEVFSAILPVFTGISDTKMALGTEVLGKTDEGYSLVKAAARKGGSNLREALARIKAILKRKPKTPPTV